jgi:8-amino-7-oxononanoate synthase
MDAFLKELAARRRQRELDGLARRLEVAHGIDFCSNDYLGFAADGTLAAAVEARMKVARSESNGGALGTPASRLLRGTTADHLRLERRLASFKGAEAALLFSTGYQANLGVLTALIGPRDRAVSDALNHASLIDGLRLAGCHKVIVPHLDVAAIEAALTTPHPGGRTFLVTESLFSMDGDQAPLARYAELAARHGAELIIDDAHATGLYGERGGGLVAALGIAGRATAVTSTFGKALGLFGAAVSGPRAVIDHLVDHARSFVFTTAPPPLLLWAVEAALDRIEAEPWRRQRTLGLARRLRDELARRGVACTPGDGPIVPVVVGDNRRALAVAEEVQAAGFDVRAVRPPTVPDGTARLRLSVHASHSTEQIDVLAAAVATALAHTRPEMPERQPRPPAAPPRPAAGVPRLAGTPR